ncbi:MAG TPA: HAMP domain-containing sensor histidine kinase [Euzebyales bacterium]
MDDGGHGQRLRGGPWHEARRGGPPWRSGQPPPWWPDGEPWPPRHGPGSQEWAAFGRRVGRKLLAVVLLVLAAPVFLGLVVASTIGGADGALAVAAVWIVMAVLVAGAATVLWRTWAPIRRLIGAAGRLADGDYDTRVDATGPVLTRPVLASFNRMAARLQAADEQRRQLLADVGHELRTPLTVLRGDLEAMVDGVRPVDPDHLRQLLDDIAVVERLLDDLRTLSLAESGALVLHREPSDIGEVARDAVDHLARVAIDEEVQLRVDAVPVPVIDVDRARIHQVVSNLVGNAIGATPPGGDVTVVVREGAGGVVLDVRDTGVGIPTDQVDLVFERFHKGAGSSGTGLGLTISRDLVAAHGGTLDIAETSPAGTTMRITLPGG